MNANNTTPENNDSNISINDWKLKIKIPKSISIISYTLDNNTWLSITGTPINDGQTTATVGLVKVEKATVESGNAQQTSLDKAVFLDDDYTYYLIVNKVEQCFNNGQIAHCFFEKTTKLFRVLTGNFIGVKMCFRAHFLCKIVAK